ncbi:WH2 domain-containing protein [Wolbachia endosymbiont (group B) of Germaria angustata]|uniref:WH2 domain-containing protein n=1 Tax=Wolbachia endosymbiont (group B) of Germaria angustata TaxID=3077916 RepID=UPI0031331528
MGKNWKPAKNNDKNENTLGSTPSKTSNSTQLRKVQSKSPVQQSSLNFAENPLFKKKQEEHNVNSETADEGSNIRQSEPNRGLTHKPVSTRVFSSQQGNCNSNKPSSNSGTNNSTQSEKGLSENPIQLATEQKIDTPILVNTSVGISKATALKYSIATLLLCISSVTAGIYTYLAISATLSAPVLFTVIAFVSASVMLSLAAYLINSHLSAINSEKKVDPGREQSQDLQKAKELEQSNTYTSSLSVIAETPILPPPPPPPPLPQNAAPLPPPPTASKCTEKPKNGAQEKANESEHDRSALLEQIRKGGVKLKRVNNEVENAKTPGNNKDGKSQDFSDELKEKLKSRRKGIVGKDNVQQPSNLYGAFSKISAIISPLRSRSGSVSSRSSEESEQDWSDNESTYSTPLNPQLDNKKRRDSSDSGHESDDNVKPKSTTPPRSASKVEKPPISPKPVNSKAKCEASPAAQANNVDPVNNEVQKPSSLVSQKIKFFSEKSIRMST